MGTWQKKIYCSGGYAENFRHLYVPRVLERISQDSTMVETSLKSDIYRWCSGQLSLPNEEDGGTN